MKIHISIFLIAAITAVAFSLPVYAQKGKPVESFTDEDVTRAIEKGVKYLWSLQLDDGSWGDMGRPDGSTSKYYITGLTALACYALLDCGADSQDPRMQKALEWMAKNQEKPSELKDGRGETADWWTYSVGLRCNVWLAANKTTRNKYLKNLEKDVNWLIDGTSDGGYGYVVPSKSGSRAGESDNSNAQYGVLGVWAGQRAGMEIPLDYWNKCMKYWLARQNSDGGWCYREAGRPSYGNMTAAGVATMFVCVDAVMGDKFIKCNQPVEIASIKKGLDWFDKNFERTFTAPTGYESGAAAYYLYCLERVGLASGYKYFGKMDWYKEGTRKILGVQEENGGWRWGGYASAGKRDSNINRSIDATSFCLLFLIRGQRPVMFNKLEYKGDWNNRPRDCANLCRWMGKALEKDVNWQIITLKSEVGEWHDAPIVYIGGSIRPDFSDEDVAKLRTYVQQGGTLFVMTQCGGRAFSAGMKELYKKLFPKYELQVIGSNHEFYKLHGLTGGKVPFSMIHNGIRPLVLHTDADLSLQWQQYAVATGKHAFDAATTILLYVTDKQIRNRGVNLWPAEPAGSFSKTVKIAKLKYAGNCDAEPLAMERFGRLMGSSCGIKVDYSPELVEITALKEFSPALAIMTGTTAFSLKENEKAALKDYIEHGGMVFLDAGGGSKPFGESAKKLIDELCGNDKLLPLPMSHPIYLIKDMTITKVKYRRATRARIGGMKEPRLMAVLDGDRPKFIFSQEDIIAGLVGFPSYACDGYEPESAFDIMRNLVLYAAANTATKASQSQPAK